MKILIILIAISLSTLCAQVVKVAVAANVSYAMKDLIKAFNKSHPNIKVQTTIGGSGKLVIQIRHGAPYDIFMSANMAYPDALFKEGLVVQEPKVYAKGALAMLSVTTRDFSQGLKLLENKDIKTVAVANAKTAPYGKATQEALNSAKLYNKLKPKFVYGESIGQTLIYTLKAADIGFVAKSLLYSPKMAEYKEGKNWISVDKTLYTPIKQGVALIKNAPKEAKEFYNFLFSKEAKEIFKSYGYEVE